MGELFALDYDLLLYDVTSTYFEGQAARNPLAQRGYSRDHRPDCKQVCIALVVTREGLPLGYEVFAGNRTDVTTVEEIVETMETPLRHGPADLGDGPRHDERGEPRLAAADRAALPDRHAQERAPAVGRASSPTRRTGRRCATASRSSCASAPTAPRPSCCVRSAERREKEQAMHERFASASTRDWRGSRGGSRTPAGPWIAGRSSGRSAACSRATPAPPGATPSRWSRTRACAAGVRLTWTIRPEWEDWARWSEGCYVLRTNIPDWTPEDLWRTYIQLTEAEAAFRIHKSDLSIRPIWHQREDRVQAHILVCFLAYVLWKTLEQWQSRAGLGNSPRTILEELRRIQSTDVILPTAVPSIYSVRLVSVDFRPV